MNRTLVAAAALLASVMSAPAHAADETTPAPGAAPFATAEISAGIGTVAPNIAWSDNKLSRRPALLPMLYVSYAALQAYDVYSTRQALARGAREANPLMQGVVGNTGAFVAMKAGVAVATIAAAEKLWKTNRPAAIGVMIAGNSVAAIVAARNTRTLGQLR
jgi:uncharacterized protein DUF5658